MKDAAATATSHHGRLRPTTLPLSDVRFIIDKFETAGSRQCIARKSELPGELLVRSQYQKPAQSLSDCEVRSRGLVLNVRSCDTEVFYVDRDNRGYSVSTAVQELGRSSLCYTDRHTRAKGREGCASDVDELTGNNVHLSVPNLTIDEKGAACITYSNRRAGISVDAFHDSSSVRCKDNRRTNVKGVNRAQILSDSDCVSSVCLPGYLGGGFPLDVLESSVREAVPVSSSDFPIWRLGSVVLTACLIAPRMFTYVLLYPFCRLVFGTLYPAYASYKAVRSKNVKEYVKWMMYWIVFALFTCAETFTDVLFSWFPFYYEVKIVLVLWLLSPATKGSSILYRKFVHPALSKREQEIDEYITKATEQGYHTVLNLGSKGVNYATTVIVQTAIKGGGGLVQQLRKSYSLSDLSESDPRLTSEAQAMIDEADDVMCDPRLVRRNIASRSYATRRSASESNSRAPLYFPEVDVDIGQARVMAEDFSYVKSSEDISSGYSSADNSAAKERLLTRAGSIGASRVRTRTPNRTGLTTVRRPQAAEDSEDTMEELQGNERFHNCDDYPTLIPSSPSPFPYPYHLSQTEPPFLFKIVDNKIKIVQLLDIVKNTNLVNTHPIFDENEQGVQENIVFEDAQKQNFEQKPTQVSNSGIEPEFKSTPEVVTNLESTLPEEKEITKNEDLITNINNIIPKDNETKDFNTNNNIHSNETNKSDNFNFIPIVVDLTQSQNDLIECDEHGTEKKSLDTSSLNTKVYGKGDHKEKSALSNSQSNDSLFCMQPSMNSSKELDVAVSQDLQKSERNILDVPLLRTEMSTKDENKEKSALSLTPSNASLNSTQISIESSKDMLDAMSNADSSSINNYSEDSEDAFVTPGSSPRMFRKKTKGGKYGKRLAPPPPTPSDKEGKEKNDLNMENAKYAGSSKEENLKKIKRVSPIKATLVLKPGIVKEIGPRESSSGKPAEIFISDSNKRKRRIKMKTKPLNSNKHESPITKLKQLPGKLAFWHKADKSKLETDSDSSDGYSMRSSDYEDSNDMKDIENTIGCKTFDGCINIPNVVTSDDKGTKVTDISSNVFEDTAGIEADLSETLIVDNLSQPEDNQVLKDVENIIEKSDVLQKLIEAKLVDHPEYKFTYIPLHGTYNDASKSTDV